MKPYSASFQSETIQITNGGTFTQKRFESNCNAIYFRVNFVTAPGSVPGTGLNWDQLISLYKPRINGIPVQPQIVGKGGFASTVEDRNIAAGPDFLAFECPDPYGLILEDYVFECEAVVGNGFPMTVTIIRRKIAFIDQNLQTQIAKQR
jgi:hypothetical protein